MFDRYVSFLEKALEWDPYSEYSIDTRSYNIETRLKLDMFVRLLPWIYSSRIDAWLTINFPSLLTWASYFITSAHQFVETSQITMMLVLVMFRWTKDEYILRKCFVSGVSSVTFLIRVSVSLLQKLFKVQFRGNFYDSEYSSSCAKHEQATEAAKGVEGCKYMWSILRSWR